MFKDFEKIEGEIWVKGTRTYKRFFKKGSVMVGKPEEVYLLIKDIFLPQIYLNWASPPIDFDLDFFEEIFCKSKSSVFDNFIMKDNFFFLFREKGSWLVYKKLYCQLFFGIIKRNYFDKEVTEYALSEADYELKTSGYIERGNIIFEDYPGDTPPKEYYLTMRHRASMRVEQETIGEQLVND
jgi:hypothetical protein